MSVDCPLQAVSESLSLLLAKLHPREDQPATDADAADAPHADAAAMDERSPLAGVASFQELQGQSLAAAAAARQQEAVLSQIIHHLSSCSRRCDASHLQLQAVAAATADLQQGAVQLQQQLVTTADNQQTAAGHTNAVLGINRLLQGSVEQLTAELEDEREARRALEQQVEDLQQQMRVHNRSLQVLHNAATAASSGIEQLQDVEKESSKTVAALATAKSSLHQRLKKMQLREQHLGRELRETQAAVAAELAGLRRHVQLAGNRSVSAARAHRQAVTARLAAVSHRVEVVARQAEALTRPPCRSGSAGPRAGAARVKPGGRQLTRRDGSSGVQHAQMLQQQQEQQLLADALMTSESSSDDIDDGGGCSGAGITAHVSAVNRQAWQASLLAAVGSRKQWREAQKAAAGSAWVP